LHFTAIDRVRRSKDWNFALRLRGVAAHYRPRLRRWHGHDGNIHHHNEDDGGASRLSTRRPVIAVLRIVEFVNALERKEIGKIDRNPPWLRG
jgi:hypothetical protein